jgi:hypothetical protein
VVVSNLVWFEKQHMPAWFAQARDILGVGEVDKAKDATHEIVLAQAELRSMLLEYTALSNALATLIRALVEDDCIVSDATLAVMGESRDVLARGWVAAKERAALGQAALPLEVGR